MPILVLTLIGKDFWEMGSNTSTFKLGTEITPLMADLMVQARIFSCIPFLSSTRRCFKIMFFPILKLITYKRTNINEKRKGDTDRFHLRTNYFVSIASASTCHIFAGGLLVLHCYLFNEKGILHGHIEIRVTLS